MSTFPRLATLAVIATMLTGPAFAADLAIPPPIAAPNPSAILPSMPLATPKEIPVQQNQPHCSRWTDDCVTCMRGANNDAPTCSNIGFACQPKAVRCLSDDTPQSDPKK